VALHRPGQADAERLVESLNGRFRDECCNEHLFRSLPAARRLIEEWRIDYNPAGRIRALAV
jgi:putative transposase